MIDLRLRETAMPTPNRPQTTRATPIRGTRVRRPVDLKNAGAFAYFAETITTPTGDKRLTVRRRTRLRAGKILDLSNGFLAECQIYDRSAAGARLRVLGGCEIPRFIRLYEDERDCLVDADVVWRRGSEAGIRLVGIARGPNLSRTHLTALRGKFYAMRS
jgi:hypothetical protein